MLGRAVKEYQPSKRDLANQLSTPSPTPKIEDSLKRNSSQSIGGYTNAANRGAALRNLSPNAHMPSNLRTNAAAPSKALPRSNSGLASVLERDNAFQDVPFNMQDASTNKPGSQVFESNGWMDDFPDDADIDLDDEESSALPNLSLFRYNPLPVQPVQNHKPEYTLPKLPGPSRSQNITSSAQTWSSSSPSHKATPSGAKRQHGERSGFVKPELTSEDSMGANPRSAKRRTLPWTAKKTEEEIARRDMAEAEAGFTPLPKDTKGKQLPWNASLSTVKDQQKSYRNQNKLMAKNSDASFEDMLSAAGSRPLKSGKTPYSPISLNDEQNKILNLVVDKKKSVFFTGSAGTGKSVLMRSIIEKLKKKHARDPERLCVTASTGLAACNIGGQTLHSFAGIGLGKEDVPTLVKKIKRNGKSKNRWIKCQILVIDEISMVDGELFDKLEAIARNLKNNGRPFGGIQLVITGDFFQLPPVPDQGKAGVRFSFEAATWNTAIDHTIGLTQVFRQKDPVFANMLNEMRLGRISDATVKAFKSLTRDIGHDVTELFPTRNEVENSNAMRLRQLVGKSETYNALDSGTLADPVARQKLLSNMMAPQSITLKKGAQVMLIKNVDESLVNGSLGHVVGFMSEKTFELYDHDPDAFEEGYGEEEGLSSKEKNHRQKLREKISCSKSDSSQKLLPLVKFQIADGTTRDMLMQYDEWKVELPNGEIVAQRSQIPLILAWALSIHKAQGQTLERVKVDLGKVFEKGQAYVALSRATCQEGLQVLRFDKNKVMAHPKVVCFYTELYGVDQVGKMTISRAVTSKTNAVPVRKVVKQEVRQEVKKDNRREEKREVRQEIADLNGEEEEELMRMGGWG